MALSLAQKFINLGVVTGLAVELANQINLIQFNWKRLAELSMPPPLAKYITESIDAGTYDARKAVSYGLPPTIAALVETSSTYLLPANDFVGYWGDSKTKQGFPVIELIENNGVQFWGPAMAEGRVRTRFDLQFAQAGDTLEQMAARIPAVIASDAGSVVILGGSNSVAADVPLETMKTQMLSMIDAAVAASKIVILGNETPKGGTDFPAERLTGTRLTTMVAFRDWCKTQARPSEGVYFWDSWGAIANPLAPTDNISGSTRDGIHWSTYGAYLLGKPLATIFRRVVSDATSYLPTSASDPRLLSTNPFLTGTTGTLNTGTSGQLGTGYTALVAGGAVGNTIVYSKVTGDAQRVQVAGTPAGSAALDLARQISLQAGWGASKYVEGLMIVTVQPGAQNIRSIKAGVSVTDNAVTTWYTSGDETSNTGDLIPNFATAERLVIRVPRVIKGAAVTDLRLRPGMYTVASVPSAADFVIETCALMQYDNA